MRKQDAGRVGEVAQTGRVRGLVDAQEAIAGAFEPAQILLDAMPVRLAQVTLQGGVPGLAGMLDQVARREAAQMPLERKRAKADIVIDNSGSPEQTYEQVEAIWQGL